MLDCSITPVSIPGVDLGVNLKLVSTVDFFTPSIDNPYMQGEIGCCNVLSDLYALGITKCDNMLMTLAVSRDMKEEESDVITTEMLRGFTDMATEAGTKITGGQTIRNTWPIIGGVAMSIVREDSIISPNNLAVGDVLVLTKPLGTQIAVNLHQWLATNNTDNLAKVKDVISTPGILSAYSCAIESMRTLNKAAAELMQKYDVHGCTDVTGFGIVGHASNLAKSSSSSPSPSGTDEKEIKGVAIEVDVLPCIRGTAAVDLVRSFRLHLGLSAETSGGLLIAMPEDQADQFISDYRATFPASDEGECACSWGWKVGRVVEYAGDCEDDVRARIVDNVQTVEVDEAGVQARK